MSALFLDEPGSVMGVSGNSFVVSKNDSTLQRLPCEIIDSISVFGPVQISSHCIEKCLKKGIRILYYSYSGQYYGKIEPLVSTNAGRVRALIRCSEQGRFQLDFSKKIISSKVNNQSVVLRRYSKSSNVLVENEIDNMKMLVHKIENANGIEELMGYEGNAAKLYFSGLSKMINKDFKFEGRSKHPPKDPFNAMLSFGYSILANEFIAAIEARGLNAYFGIIHKDKNNHAALASDLMEEWRPVIVDSVVLGMINGHEVCRTDFTDDEDSGGVFMERELRRKYIVKLQNRFNTKSKYLKGIDYELSFRNAIYKQVDSLIAAIEEDDISEFKSLKIR